MKLRPPRLISTCWLALAFAILPGLHLLCLAQTPESKPETTPAAPVASESSASAEKAPVQTAPAPTDAPVVSATTPEAKVEPAAPKEAEEVSAERVGEDEGKVPAIPATEPAKKQGGHKHASKVHRPHGDNARVSILHDSTLAAGGEADAVVSILGSSTSAGTVADAVVSVGGSSTSSGDVGDAVVSILGNTRVTGGTVGDAAVSVLGNNYINAHIKGQVVAVMGNVELGPDAVVDGEVICVGGEVVRDPKAVLHGGIQNVAIGGHHFSFDWLSAWVTKCLLYARPLAFGAHLMWAWWIALAYLGVYALIALLAPGAVSKCVQTLEERPGKSILSSVLTLLLTPVVYVLLALTVFIVIGVALIPLFSLGLFFASIFGKVVMLAWLGRRISKLIDAESRLPAVLNVLIGGVLILLLYTVPVLGFVIYKLLGILGLGVVVYTLLLSIKSNRPPVPVKSVAMASAPTDLPPIVGSGLAEPSVIPVSTALPPVISAATLVRAGFWLRIGATLLDVVLFGMIFGMLHSMWAGFGGGFPLWFAAYNVIMWATKGTTIGGIICGLKVVRLDDRPLDWGVAVVRALSAFLSLAVAGLGFIWVAFDDEKQSWHDKVAGTVIVRVPKATSLV